MPKVHTGGKRAGGGGGGSGGKITIYSETDMMSARKKNDVTRKAAEQVYQVAIDIEREYNYGLRGAVQVSDIGRSNALAYYDSKGNVGVNKKYFDADKMNEAYARCVAAGFHPSNGNKTGMEAVIAHEYGHALTEAAIAKTASFGLHGAADVIVREARALTNHKTDASFREAISGYAKKNSAEAVAEAFADHFCNGDKAKAESKTLVQTLLKYI